MTEWFRVEDEAKQKGVIINIIGPDRMNRNTMQETPGEATITGTKEEEMT
jgi:hypothetical protein